jgi:3-ketosteroid 9alpha-monooxygenase subunit B
MMPLPGGDSMPREHDQQPLLVSDVIDETADARSFVLDVPAAQAARFAYVAGQFCTFHAEIDGAPVVRCYSMSSSPETGDPLTVTVKRVPGGKMSNWLNDTLRPGATIDVAPPAGAFVLREADTPIVAFAGGSGITPVLSIVKSALATTAREIRLVYANRDRGGVIFAAALDALVARFGERLSVHHHLDQARGFLDATGCGALVGDRTHADFYVCGPGPYMDVVAAALDQRGVDAERVFIERFELPASAGDAVVASATESLVIRLDGRRHAIAYEQGDTILDAARRAGLKPPFNCQGGNCATCMAFVDEGQATMRFNNVLSGDEVDEGWVLTCQAIPTSRAVVVDYDR